MKTVKMITRVLGAVLVLNSTLQGQITMYYDLNVGTAAAPDLRTVNWGTRGEQTGGTWGVSSESFLGFTLTSLVDGAQGSELGYDATTSRTLGVNNAANEIGNTGRIVYRTNSPTGREAIRLALPTDGAAVGVIGGPDAAFAGISQVAFDRLNNGTGNIVTIAGFVADPQASWAISPFVATPPTLTYNAGTLSFETLNATDWTGFGLLQFGNLSATLAESGVSLVFSNDRANNNNSYGLVGWQYAVVPEAATQSLLVGLALLGLVIARRLRSRNNS